MTPSAHMKIDEARRSFFVETEGAPDGFARPGWRGAVLYRDAYDRYRMPRLLWDALREAGGPGCWWISGYGTLTESEPDARAFWFEWDAFAEMPANPADVSSEWVAYNDAQTIAVLAEFDVTVVGAVNSVADDIDRLLAASDTSLRKLTHIDFPVHDRLAGFIRSVIK
ncbi:hypothetical protein FIV34_11360 [Luteibacter pinisoli]|uniref:Uncharacterized protein n=1 Tax=Luteibacter pinisoli TaxID=2589080 RepID=A0A4Y5Z5C5_9GAMM|nr:hypothetical protein [Luteibacter pinisoli]QDE39759.1 hypothetical protein FIV34_11360 [Luteibacter pinisoli]